jgi:hypothetical protein
VLFGSYQYASCTVGGGGGTGTSGSCTFRNTAYANGSVTSCTVNPSTADLQWQGACPLGLPVSSWMCSDGQWVSTTNTTTGGSCVAPPDGKVYANGQSATYADWCPVGTAAAYCGSGTEICQNGTWVSTVNTTTGGSCVAHGTVTYPNGSTISSLCYPPGPAVCPLGLLVSQWICSNGQWVVTSNGQ